MLKQEYSESPRVLAVDPLKTIMIDALKVAIYIRWSIDEQGDGTTLEVQKENCIHFVLSQGWQVNLDLIFIDDGWSGGNLGRPAMIRMRKMIQEGKIDCVVVYKLDRLSRSVVDTVNLVLKEWEGHCYIKSSREPVDTMTPMGKQFFYMLVSFAEWERSVIKERTYSGKLQRVKDGMTPGFKAPYGYKKSETVKGGFDIVPHEKLIVNRIYTEYENMIGCRSIMTKLNDEGILNRKGELWSSSAIEYILSNPIYGGMLAYRRRIADTKRKRPDLNKNPYQIRNKDYMLIKSNFIPITIEYERWQRIQELRKSKNVKVSGVSGRSYASEFLLSGLVRCTCGYALCGQRGNRGVHYYRCNGSIERSHHFCSQGRVRQKLLEKTVMDEIKAQFLNGSTKSSIMAVLDDMYSNKIKILESNTKELERTLAKFKNQNEKIEKDYRTGQIDANTFNRFYRQFEQDKSETMALINQNAETLEKLKLNAIGEKEIDEFISYLSVWEQLEITEQKSILRNWIHRIVVQKINKDLVEIEITYQWEMGKGEALAG